MSVNRTILNYNGDTEVVCDDCGMTLHLDCCNKDTVNEKKKELGYRTYKINGVWYVFCSKLRYEAFL